ncbi:MAG TPA: LAGLIDADG family homing endonuclease, partial [Candidatus Paceibacterota bacterium]|nr:LAGLIDADG family homing endonuclease [Candidatus Paceibacterota bacterium]
TGKFITQYEMKSVGEDGVGLLKFDFLGIKNLAILADAVKRVKKIRQVEVDIENIPLDDSKTFAILAHGETMGLFQLNGTGITAFLKQLKPSTIHDINAMVALYRPGPMESIPQYIERKHDANLISYLDPRLKPILDMSYGVITYQDDVMTIARELAGYSWLEADMLRKAMGKKIPEVMAAEKDKLLTGFVEYGKLTPALANKLWNLIEPFAAYGFNKCLTADTRVTNALTGIPEKISNLFAKQQNSLIYAISSKNQIVPTTASAPFENGVKSVFKLSTRSGRSIRATDNHPFLTWNGWTTLGELKPGDRIATPRQIPNPKTVKLVPKYKAAALGYLLAEGNLCHPHGVYFYSKSEAEVEDFVSSAQQFENAKITIEKSKVVTSVYVGQVDQKKGNHLRQWLSDLELLGLRATEKHVPDCIFSSDHQTIATFLGKLWQGDGTASLKNEQVFYATSSSTLAHDVQHLLLRLSILSTIHTKRFNYRDGFKTGWTIVVTGKDNLFTFAETVGKHLIGQKQAVTEAVAYQAANRTNSRGHGTVDTIPATVLQLIRNEMTKTNTPAAALAASAKVAERLFYNNPIKRGYTRAFIEKVGRTLDSELLINHATSDIFWDEIISIEPDGQEMTYDLSVPELQNFLANDIIVHNSHAASYGRVAYQTAYMKANFSVEYMSAVLTADSGDTEKIFEIIRECERMGIEVLPPDINESFADFSVVPGKKTIRFGLTTIKNFGAGISDAIITERKKNGPFASLNEFLSRVHDRNLNKKSLEALIMTGALDSFGERGIMLANIETLLTFNKEQVAEKASAQESLFGLDSGVTNTLTLDKAPSATKIQKLIWEKELLGVYVSGHPLDEFATELAKRPSITEIKSAVEQKEEIAIVRLKGELVTAGMVSSVRELLTKKGDRMAFVVLSDTKSDIEMVAFPKTYLELKEVLTVGNCIAVKGKLSIRNDDPSIMIDKAKLLSGKVDVGSTLSNPE